MTEVIARPPVAGKGPAIVTIADSLHGSHWDGARRHGWGTVRIAPETSDGVTKTLLTQTLDQLQWYDGSFVLAATGNECRLAAERAASLGADAVVAMFPPADFFDFETGCPVLVLDSAYRDEEPVWHDAPHTIYGPWASAEVHTLLEDCVLDIPDDHLVDPAVLAVHWFANGCATALPQYFHGVCDWFIPQAERNQLVDLAAEQPELKHISADPYPAVPHSAQLPLGRDDVWRWNLPESTNWHGRARLTIDTDPGAGAGASHVVGTLAHNRGNGVHSILTDAVGYVDTTGRCELVFGAAAFAPKGTDELIVEVTATRSPRHLDSGDVSMRLRGARLELPAVSLRAPDSWPVYRPDLVSSNSVDHRGSDVATQSADAALSELVDPRSGLVTSVETAPGWVGLPDGVHLLSAQVASLDDYLAWPADRIAMGMGFDEATAFNAAVGESIERYCGNFVPTGLQRATWHQLQAAGARAVHPDDFALLSAEQYAQPDCPFEPLTPDLSIEWATGIDLSDGQATAVPASLVWVNHHLDSDEPRTHPHNLAGLAAGRDLYDAERSALEEIIERDSVQIWWLAGLPASGIELDPTLIDEGLACEGGGWYHHRHLPYRIRIVAIPTTWPVPVVGVYLHHLHDDLHVLGLAARPNPLAAVRKGWLEALALQGYARGLLDPDGDVWHSLLTGVFVGHGIKPWRADRRYRSEYATDYRDLLDLSCHSQIWLDPAMRTELGPILGDGQLTVSLCDLERPVADPRGHYLRAMAEKNIHPVSVDVTTPDIETVGPRVVRVIAPGAYMNTPAGYPLAGGRRLYDDAAVLGRERPLTMDTINLSPLPHT